MKTEYLTYEEQLLIAEDLYNMTDSVEAARKLEEECGIDICPGHSVKLTDFARKLDKTKFLNHQIEKAITQHSGHNIRLGDL
ncbi:hypothetical protein KKF32_01530 [Patescibacteria group bacterium]|nr:hypothetical protein [Patescibacteria group bacterium]